MEEQKNQDSFFAPANGEKREGELSSSSGSSQGNLTLHSLTGEVEKVIYESPDSSFQIVYLKDAAGIRHTVCGPLAGAYTGVALEVTGSWEHHKEYGRQMRAVETRFTLPSTVEGIEKYLASGVIKGIGEKYAKLIVETFGSRTLEVLDHASCRLKEVPGLGKKRVKSIQEAWKASSEKRALQIYMQSLGITPAYFTRIYAIYGNKASEILQKNPYRLAAEVDGIGFLLADRIAEKTGIGKTDDARLLAGAIHALTQIRQAGHTCIPEEKFLQMASNLLDVPEELASRALTLAVNENKATVTRDRHNTPMVYETAIYKCEKELPRLLGDLLNAPRHAGSRMQKFQELKGCLLSSEQLQAVRQSAYTPLSIITGGPGVGKTTVVAEILRRANLAKLKTALCAPTGRAAKRMSESTSGALSHTIHRLLKWDPGQRKFVHGKNNPLPFDLFILDESSMLDLLLAVAFFRAVPPGATVILVGDCDQLPSVGPGNILNDLISCGHIEVTRLTKIFRQGEGSGIIQGAHAVNQGFLPIFPPSGQGMKQDFYWIEKEDPEEVSDIILRLMTERIPKAFHFDPMKDIQLITPMNRGCCGTILMNQKIQEALNPKGNAFRHGERHFRVGDRVMQTANDYDKGVFNGDMGKITTIDHADSSFRVLFDKNLVQYSFSDADSLVHAYAVTVHKSQGSEFAAVIMPLLTQHYMMLQRNLLYTGMTRAKKLMILVGSRKALSLAVSNGVREERFTLLQEYLHTTLGTHFGRQK